MGTQTCHSLTLRYFKTTLYGLSGCAPDYVMLMVGGNAGLIGMSKVSFLVPLEQCSMCRSIWVSLWPSTCQ